MATVSSPELSRIREVVGASRRREAVFCTFWILAITWKRANYFDEEHHNLLTLHFEGSKLSHLEC